MRRRSKTLLAWSSGKDGTDAPICQDTPSGGLDDLLTSAEVGHDALLYVKTLLQAAWMIS